MIKVLVVDDSAFMRSIVSRMISKSPDIEVVGTAKDGIDALEKIKQLNPDVITLDIEMPNMDGLACLEIIMKTNPKPVLMISSITMEGADSTIKALELGALDFIPKYTEDTNALNVLADELHAKIKAIAKRGRFMRPPVVLQGAVARLSARMTASNFIPKNTRLKRDIVAIGVSTGGPPAISLLLSELPANFPACIFIAQHMPATFTFAFAKRLNSLSALTVKEAETGDRISNGFVYVCPGGKHLRVDIKGSIPELIVTADPQAALYKPSATVLMESLAISMPHKTVGLTMTGMGSDGLEGTRKLKEKGGYIMAQNEASCVVYGMPKAVIDANLTDETVDIKDLAMALQGALYK